MKIAAAGLMCYLVALLSFINLPLHGQEASRLPKGAKLEAVLYKNADMVGLGYRYKKQFVENQQVEFFKLHDAERYKMKKKKDEYYVASKNKTLPVTSLKPLLQGIYFTANGMAYVEGEWYPKEKSMYKGTFLISYAWNGIRPTDIQEFYVETNGATLSGKSPNNDRNYKLEIKLLGDKNGNKIKKIECVVPKDNFFKLLTEEDIIYNSLHYIGQEKIPINILFGNGNRFNGSMAFDEGYIIPAKGICKYATGETFNGMYDNIFWDKQNEKVHIPTQGTMTFTDGTTATGNWLKADDFTKEDWASIYKEGDSPTAIRDKFLRKKRELAEVKRRQELEEQRKKQEELRKKQEQERQKMLRRQQLIAKYGQHYGALLSQRKLELGMTKEMVNEVWNKEFFDCSEFIISGNKVEIWTFNENNIAAVAAREKGKDGLMAMLFINQLVNMFGVGYGNPYQLTFTNGRLTEIIR